MYIWRTIWFSNVQLSEMGWCWGGELGNFMQKISGNLFWPFWKFVHFFISYVLIITNISKSSTAKWCCKIIMFLILRRSLCFNFTHCVQKKITCFIARLPGLSVNSNEKYRHYNCRLLQKFLEIKQKFRSQTKGISNSYPNSVTIICHMQDNSSLNVYTYFSLQF